MRWRILITLLCLMVLGFVVVVHFPQLLKDYPLVQDASRRIRLWLGMESPPPSFDIDSLLEKTDQAFPGERGQPGRELQEYPQ